MSYTIDAHTHIGVVARPGMSQSAEQLVARLDSAGVDKAVTFPFPEGNGVTGDVRANNDVVTQAVKAYPDRLIPFCIVNPWHGALAVEELRHCVEDLGFKGVKLHPTLHGYRLADHALVDPLFAAARDLGIVITSHGAGDLLNNPAEFAEMARAFPTVPLLMVHMGVFWSTDHAVEASKAHPNLYLDTSRAPIWEIQVAVKALGPEKVIWGTDAPFVDYPFEFQKMVRATTDPEGHALIVGGTIARLLRLAA
jgi:uncharacterized protein